MPLFHMSIEGEPEALTPATWRDPMDPGTRGWLANKPFWIRYGALIAAFVLTVAALVLYVYFAWRTYAIASAVPRAPSAPALSTSAAVSFWSWDFWNPTLRSVFVNWQAEFVHILVSGIIFSKLYWMGLSYSKQRTATLEAKQNYLATLLITQQDDMALLSAQLQRLINRLDPPSGVDPSEDNGYLLPEPPHDKENDATTA